MIHVKNLKITYGDSVILENTTFELPRKGLVCICGDSGCGKSSFLNALSGFIPFEGSISVDGIEIKELNDNDSADFRLRNIGFVFQDFKLFVNQNVEQNIIFPLDVLTNYPKRKKVRRCNDLLQLVGLNKYNKRICNNLSGGEKQRVAICRALINNPKIILADEPTGSLDSNSGIEIIEILKQFSNSGLVLMVTHDLELANQYADEIIYLKDKGIEKIQKFTGSTNKTISLLNCDSKKLKNNLPFKFAINHAKQSMKTKYIRTMLSTLFMSIGLMGIGLSVSFSNSIANDIKRSYASLVETANVSILKDAENIKLRNVSYEDTFNLCRQYNSLMPLKCGVGYRCNFEEFFKDSNSFYIESKNKMVFLDELSARNINDFLLLEDIEFNVLPNNIDYLEDDEIVVGLTINQVRKICMELGIERTANSLGDFIREEIINIVLDVANLDWEYTDQQIFRVKGFILSNEPFIAHTNSLFNEVVLEENMRFPTNEKYALDEFPWVMEKISYISTNDNYKFIKLMREKYELERYVFEVCDKNLFVNKYFGKEISSIDAIVPYYSPKNRFHEKEIEYVESIDESLRNPIIYNNRGYVNYPNGLISGFANRTYFSFNDEDLFTTIENNASVEFANNEKEVLMHSVSFSDFTEHFNNPIKFSSNLEGLAIGRKPDSLKEIAVSTGLFKKLGGNYDENPYLFMATATKEINKDIGIYYRDYVFSPLKIVGVVNDDNAYIYHDEHWTEDYFLLEAGLKAKEVLPNSISFAIEDDSDVDLIISKLNRAFPQYEIINPLLDINESIETLCNSISIFVLCISSVSLIISFILLCSCTYIHIQDIKKEIALARCIGINNKESLKFLYGFTVYSSTLALIISSFELTMTNAVISLFSSQILGLPFEFSITYSAFIIMVIGCVSICLITSLLTSKHISKIKPLDCLKI
ncbi:MAG: ABC transporter ATP-binding protein/permease [Bacilli bacterium]|nr:ABC transporter ATP-binding protein/permease [Bacilli bacterium]